MFGNAYYYKVFETSENIHELQSRNLHTTIRIGNRSLINFIVLRANPCQHKTNTAADFDSTGLGILKISAF